MFRDGEDNTGLTFTGPGVLYNGRSNKNIAMHLYRYGKL